IPHYARVPSVLGLPLDRARQTLDGAGLDVRVGSPTTSIRYQEGTVATQSDAPGTRVRKGEDVVLRVSTGPPIRTVPSVTNLTLGAARARLADRGFGVAISKRYSQTVPKDHVIIQDPSALA